MYPKWIQDQFENNRCRCTKCKAGQLTTNIIMIGVCSPHTWSNRPQGIFTTLCPLCGNSTQHTIDLTLSDIVGAVEAKFDEFESAGPAEPPPIKIPKTSTGVPDVTPAGPSDEKSKRVQPSRRNSQPLQPPTEAEIRRFLARLKVTSFKTNSKSYKKLTGPPPRKPLDEKDIKGPGEDD